MREKADAQSDCRKKKVKPFILGTKYFQKCFVYGAPE